MRTISICSAVGLCLSGSRPAAPPRARRLSRAGFLAAGERDEVVARQQAVAAELRPRIDLREQLAVMGEEVRAAVDAKTLADWGGRPPARIFPGARVVALVLACAAVTTLALFLAHLLDIRAFLAVILAEIGYNLAVREAVQKVIGAGSAPAARELRLLVLLLERLERERFTSPRRWSRCSARSRTAG